MTRPLLAALALLLLAPVARGGPPPEHHCPAIATRPGADAGTDAMARRLQEGMVIHHDTLLLLRQLLPDEIWQNRHVFFYQGMAMTIGDCHRRYPTPEFYRLATARYAGKASLDKDGNLLGYVAGQPFPPESFDLGDRQAGVRWAWNLALRFRGAGPFGHFRIVDMASRMGQDLTYLGTFFFYQTRNRADLAKNGYVVNHADGDLFVAGGRFLEPLDARHLAWRQIRPKETLEGYDKSDETFVYVPTMRKVRRAATAWVDGMYMPRYRVSGDNGGGGLPVGGGSNEYGLGTSGAINPTSALSTHQTEHLPRGFQTLTLRPNAYVWRVVGEREVLAPINSVRKGYPIDANANYGPHGLSVATDRWDVRWAVVIEGAIREGHQDYDRLLVYVDWQTQLPLYVITKSRRGVIHDVGIPVHRFSDDTINYPGWSDGELASVFDPVAEVFYRVVDDSGWRRESYDTVSTPAEERVRRRFTSTDFLVRGR